MARSLKKGPFVNAKLLKKIQKLGSSKNTTSIKTLSRSSTIVPEMIDFTFLVHDGKNYISVKVREEMVGHKLGEFAPTTKFSRHGGKMQRDIEKQAEVKQEAQLKTNTAK